MTTQYTTNLKLALPVQGELSGTWGDVVNNNITSMVEEAVAGRKVINTWTGNSHTLTSADGTTSESRAAILTLTDTGTALSGAGTVVCPAASKIYIVENGTARTITVKTASGTGIAVPVGKNMVVFCDGTNVEEGISNIVSLSVAGDLRVPVGTTGERPTAAAGQFRYNSTTGKFEGYTDSWGDIGGGEAQFTLNTMTGDGSDTTLTMSVTPASENSIQVYFDGVYQHKDTFSFSGTTLTFSTAPATGVKVEVVIISTVAASTTPGDGTVTTAKLASDSVTQAKIADDAVGADQLAASAVVTASIVDDAVTAAKLASSAVVTASVVDDAITSAKIASEPVAVGITSVVTSASITATVNTHVYVSAAGRTITLPASPTIGQRVLITVGNFTNTVVGRNGSKIMSSASDLTMDAAYLSIQFIYTDATQGWVMA